MNVVFSHVPSILVAILGIVAGLYPCQHAQEPSTGRFGFWRRLNLLGKLVLLGIPILTTISVWSNALEHAKDNATIRVLETKLDGLQVDAISAYTSDLSLRMWRSQADSALEVLLLAPMGLVSGIENAALQAEFAWEWFKITNGSTEAKSLVQAAGVTFVARMRDWIDDRDNLLNAYDDMLARLGITESRSRLNALFPPRSFFAELESSLINGGIGVEPLLARDFFRYASAINEGVNRGARHLIAEEHVRRLNDLRESIAHVDMTTFALPTNGRSPLRDLPQSQPAAITVREQIAPP